MAVLVNNTQGYDCCCCCYCCCCSYS